MNTITDNPTAAARRFLHIWTTMLGLTDRPDPSPRRATGQGRIPRGGPFPSPAHHLVRFAIHHRLGTVGLPAGR